MAEQEYLNDLQQDAKVILSMYKKGETAEKIASSMKIPFEIVSLVIDVCDLSSIYLQYCEENDEEPDYETFLKEAKDRFKNLSQEVIDLIA